MADGIEINLRKMNRNRFCLTQHILSVFLNLSSCNSHDAQQEYSCWLMVLYKTEQGIHFVFLYLMVFCIYNVYDVFLYIMRHFDTVHTGNERLKFWHPIFGLYHLSRIKIYWCMLFFNSHLLSKINTVDLQFKVIVKNIPLLDFFWLVIGEVLHVH